MLRASKAMVVLDYVKLFKQGMKDRDKLFNLVSTCLHNHYKRLLNMHELHVKI